MESIVLFLIFLLLIVWLFIVDRKPSAITQKCIKQPEKDCPYTITVNSNGTSSSGHMKCCKVRDQLKSMNEAFCNMVPGNTYGEIKITKEFHDSCLAQRKHYKNMDTSGPTE